MSFKRTKEFQLVQKIAVIQNELLDESLKTLTTSMINLINEKQIYFIFREILSTIKIRPKSIDRLYSLFAQALNYLEENEKIHILQKLFLNNFNDQKFYSFLYKFRILKRLEIDGHIPIRIIMNFISSLDIKSFPNTLSLYFIFFNESIKGMNEKLYDDIKNIKTIDWRLEKMSKYCSCADNKDLLLYGYKKNNSLIDQIVSNTFTPTENVDELENYDQGELLYTGIENIDQLAAFYGCKEYINQSKPKRNYDFYYIGGGNFDLATEINIRPLVYSRRGPVDTENDPELIDEAVHCSVLFSNYNVFCTFCTDLTITTSDLTSLLHEACFCGDELLVKLISANVDVNIEQIPNQYTPLHIACEEGHKEIVEILLNEEEIDVNCQSDLMMTPLHIAARKGFADIVKLLITDRRINPSITDIKNLTPLEVAQNEQIIKLLEPITNKNDDLFENEEDLIEEICYS